MPRNTIAHIEVDRIGEKYIEWADSREPISLETILDCVGLYWFTSSYPKTLYPYRGFFTRIGWNPISKETPIGYSYFSRELGFVPKAWIEKTYPNLVFYRAHEMVSLLMFTCPSRCLPEKTDNVTGWTLCWTRTARELSEGH